jgi:hypothetical protein
MRQRGNDDSTDAWAIGHAGKLRGSTVEAGIVFLSELFGDVA